ncbi:2,4-diaminobutyric acid acetyltransferase [Streptococcus australis]|nr:2,4-diaminobutyric acid acetyltransferase [Streptococcus australis]
MCNLQQSPRLLELCGGGKIEKVRGTFSILLNFQSSFPLPFFLADFVL